MGIIFFLCMCYTQYFPWESGICGYLKLNLEHGIVSAADLGHMLGMLFSLTSSV